MAVEERIAETRYSTLMITSHSGILEVAIEHASLKQCNRSLDKHFIQRSPLILSLETFT